MISGQPDVIVYMEPGMYCITGAQGISLQGAGKLISINTLPIGGVMIYFEKGGLDNQGNFLVELSAPLDLVDPSGNQWAGMLIYSSPTNVYPISIKGTSGSSYTGTIYAPASACELAGTGDVLVVNSQVICKTLKMTGTAALVVDYDWFQNFHMPLTVELTN